MTPAKDFYLRKVLNHESLDPRLCCAHTRCRLFKLFHVLGHTMPYLSLTLEALVVLYLGHQNLRTITILATGWIMRPRWVMFAVSLGTRITVVLLLPIFLESVVMAVLRARGPATEVRWLVRGPRRGMDAWSTGEEWRTISDEKKVADDLPLLEHLFVFAWTVVFVIPAVVVWVVTKTVFCAAIALQEADIQRRFEEYYEHPGF
ncbi:hypothetical protein CNMCM6805_004753 [Aspergillus fumigatiaffinis]|uniref:Uncharacterized protein n=1 Tax=Aspergillus fumigatiaffinis TaxID=340414 RepID=A0A8H4GQ62_9EURO|nr:hypothetical protein CNMCM6805_004753 [Aspergillus fumigatiaffinis]